MKQRNNFVLHLHNAKKAGMHYDLRIKNPNDKLVYSWAIPKAQIPSTHIVLAIETHTSKSDILSYEGEISDGYGAGHILIKQTGIVNIIKWNVDKIIFNIDAPNELLNGRYYLIKTKSDQWIFGRSKNSEYEEN